MHASTCDTLLRHRRVILLMGILGLLVGLAAWQLTPKLYYATVRIPFTPVFQVEDAVTDAEQDIRNGHIRFYFVGSIAPHAPGVPNQFAHLTQRYPSGVAGSNLGCSGSTDEQRAYAHRYNLRILQHLTQ